MGGIKIDTLSRKETKKVIASGDEKSAFDFLNKEITIFSKELNDKIKERFYSELTILFSSGVDIKSSLDIIIEQQKKEKQKKVFTEIKESILKGGSLSGAMERTEKFSAYEFYSVQIGEESGKLPDVLKELAKFYASKIKQKRQVMNALSYPILVLSSAFGAVFFMMRFMVPMFEDVFKRFKGELPAITKMIIKCSNFMTDYSLVIILFPVSIIILAYTQREKPAYRKFTSAIVQRAPIFGPLIKKIYLARFCHSMNLLISSKTPLVTSISLVKKMVGFYPIEASLDEVQRNIEQGKSLNQSLAAFPIYPQRMISLLKIAEEVNQIDTMFDKIGKQLTEEIEHETTLIGSLLEPIMIVLIGGIVAFILIAMYLPLFQLSTNVS
jgi:type IV pilus assembly protein PilC